MTRLVVFFTSFIFLLVLGTGEADARRFGGGGSKGTFSRQASPPKAPAQAANKQAPANSPAATSGRGLGGMLMGLAAGGLLAALFMGGAFEGLQIFDIILIAVVAGGLIYFIRSRRKQQAESEPQSAMSGFTRNTLDDIQQQPFNQPLNATSSNVTPKAEAAEDSGIIYGTPTWFDEKTFLEGARSHFLDLQKAWDANDLSTIKEYVTPQLYKFLQEERATQVNHVETQVHKLAVEVTTIQQLPSKIVELAIMFHGVINEGEPTDSRFCEIWHLIRDMNQENAPWLIQGIEQVES
ncbi:MAG: TIM44-like domain-containing protein [Pseudomonadaceae bacterium]|nr:TIM44-like domain-containing protein [Pseudomonadaceae bacterium]